MKSLRFNLFAGAVLALAITPSLAFGQRNTGTAGTGLLHPDPNYTLVSAPPGVTLGPVYGTVPNPAWVPPSPGSNWINPYGFDNPNAPGGNYDYQTTFTASAATIRGGFAADNSACLLLNGVQQLCTVNGIYGFSQYTGFSIPVVVGTKYTLDFVVNNGILSTGVEVAFTPPGQCQLGFYDDGPVNAGVNAWNISFGFVVSDTFNFPPNVVTGFCFNVWTQPGEFIFGSLLTSVEWSMTSGEDSGQVYGSGVAGFGSPAPSCTLLCSANTLIGPFNGFGPPARTCGAGVDDVYACTVSGLNVPSNGGTAWLNLENAADYQHDPLYWDENFGIGCLAIGCPSQASQTGTGTIPPESFVIYGH